MSTRRVRETINLAAADDYADDVLERGVRAATLDAESIAVDLVSEPGQGRVYRRRSRVHRASAPGDSPALDTGFLRASISSDVVRSPAGIVGRVKASAAYAAFLEFGTERMAARPFLSRIPREFGARIRATFNRFAK
ncbi:MAG: hypothetical protein AAFY12_11865 [Pseudomonadota bacterium]